MVMYIGVVFFSFFILLLICCQHWFSRETVSSRYIDFLSNEMIAEHVVIRVFYLIKHPYYYTY
jgi:hypothetical protein